MSAMSESEDEEQEMELKVNKKFAREFEEKNRHADLLRAERAGMLGDEDDSESDEDEDEFGNALTPKLDFDIMKTISMIHNKDKRIYDEGFKPFEGGARAGEDPEGDEDDEDADRQKSKKQKALRYKDLVRRQVLKQAEEGDPSQVFEESDAEDGGKGHIMDTEPVPTYNEEQRRLKAAFKAQAESDSDESSDDEDDAKKKKKKKTTKAKSKKKPTPRKKDSDGEDDDDDDAGILRKKEKSKEELQAEEDEFKRYMSTLAKRDPRMRQARKEDVELLETFFKEPAKDKDEAFLRSFFLNQAWAGDAANAGARPGLGDEDAAAGAEDDDDDDDEEALEAADRFEAKFNFRHEEPGGAELMGTSFDPETSVRRKESSRKRQREAKRKRKQEEKERRKEELRRLKNLKRKELEKRLEKSIEMAGLTADAKIALKPEDLDGDFDPEEFDRKMAAMFNDAYYDAEDEGFEATGDADAEKKLFGDDGVDVDDDDDDDEEEEGDEGDVNIVDRPEDDPSTQAARADDEDEAAGSGKARKRKCKKVDEAVSVAELKEKVINDQLYKMDYDDVIGDGIKTRFKYRKVTPNSYGLTTAEILFADEDLLNSFVSIKRMAPYEEKEWIATGKHRRRFREALKAREMGLTQKKEKKKKRERRKAKAAAAAAGAGAGSGDDSDAEEEADEEERKDADEDDARAVAGVPARESRAGEDADDSAASKKKTKKRKRKRKHKASHNDDDDGKDADDNDDDGGVKVETVETKKSTVDDGKEGNENADAEEPKKKSKRRRKRKKTSEA